MKGNVFIKTKLCVLLYAGAVFGQQGSGESGGAWSYVYTQVLNEASGPNTAFCFSFCALIVTQNL